MCCICHIRVQLNSTRMSNSIEFCLPMWVELFGQENCQCDVMVDGTNLSAKGFDDENSSQCAMQLILNLEAVSKHRPCLTKSSGLTGFCRGTSKHRNGQRSCLPFEYVEVGGCSFCPMDLMSKGSFHEDGPRGSFSNSPPGHVHRKKTFKAAKQQYLERVELSKEEHGTFLQFTSALKVFKNMPGRELRTEHSCQGMLKVRTTGKA